MSKMNDAMVMRYLAVLGLCVVALAASITALFVYKSRMSKPLAALCAVVFVGGTLLFILYLLITGGSANGFLD